MYIKEIKLTNYKCFEKQKITLQKGLNILIGDNGSGKTAFLDAIVIIFKGMLSGINTNYSIEMPSDAIRFKTIKLGTKTQRVLQYPTEIALSVAEHPSTQNTISTPFFELESFIIKTKENNNTIDNDWASDISKFSKNLSKLVNTEKEIPFIGYYKTSRLFQIKKNSNGSLPSYDKKFRIAPYMDCLGISINTNTLFTWIKQMTFIEFQEKKAIPELEAVKNSIKTVLRNLHGNNSDIDVYFDGKEDDLIILLDGEKYPFNTLSDGYRNTLGMIADIAYRMGELNPHIRNDTNGIVLIDELDLHLHPKWQKNIIQDLQSIFPNCQFIVTTHSPIICRSAADGAIWKLEKNKNNAEIKEIVGLEKKRLVYGNILEALGTEVFGNVASSEASEQLKNEMGFLFMKYIKGKTNKQEEERLKELRSILPTQSPITIE